MIATPRWLLAPRHLVWVLVIPVVVVTAFALSAPHATSWHFFDAAARLVFAPPPADGAGGLDAYLAHPEF